MELKLQTKCTIKTERVPDTGNKQMVTRGERPVDEVKQVKEIKRHKPSAINR